VNRDALPQRRQEGPPDVAPRHPPTEEPKVEFPELRTAWKVEGRDEELMGGGGAGWTRGLGEKGHRMKGGARGGKGGGGRNRLRDS